MRFYRDDDNDSLTGDANNNTTMFDLYNVMYRCETDNHFEQAMVEQVLHRKIYPSTFSQDVLDHRFKQANIAMDTAPEPFGVDRYYRIRFGGYDLYTVNDATTVCDVSNIPKDAKQILTKFMKHDISAPHDPPPGCRTCSDREILVYLLAKQIYMYQRTNRKVLLERTIELTLTADRMDKLDMLLGR
jgi:hypothetical protein